eukprot:TRINITY_DN1448_c0_g2_i1.p1 TRINITY_DN1448_c0_g2~~TRINITY_DN1448_c0_g2_i1.p1  ORF type:complete len:200 (-),score=7.18 TRINITY_DN1448_c0_g2_i1:10-609(-)
MRGHAAARATGQGAQSSPRRPKQSTSSPLACRVVGGLYVAVCSVLSSTVPVSVHFSAKHASCGFCAGSRVRECFQAAWTSGAPSLDLITTRTLDAMCLEVTSVSSQPISLYDCVFAVRVNAEICLLATEGRPYEVLAQSRCPDCSRLQRGHMLTGTYRRDGVIACTRGLCPMVVLLAECSTCRKLMYKDDRDQHVKKKK